MEKIKKNKALKCGLLIAVVIILALVGVLGYGSYKNRKIEEKTKCMVELAKDSGVSEDEESAPEAATIDFDELCKVNQQIYAWIFIPGTCVNYPILQNDIEEDYYLDHNLDGSSGYPSCIYTHPRNQKDFNDPDTVIYGHNMKDGSMFGSLKNYKEKAYAKNHKYLYIYTPEKVITYEYLAAYEYDDRLILDYYDDFEDPAVFQDYLNEVGSKASDDVELNTTDRLITLSTCTGDDDKRLLIQFKKCKEEFFE